MKIFEIIFSPTGGTKKVADIVANGFKKDVEIVDLMKADFDFSTVDICPDDLCVLAVPAYGGRIPAPAVPHIAALKGNGAKAVLVAVFGNRVIDETLLELQDIASSAGFAPIAGIEAVAEHSLARVYGAGRPDADDAHELADFVHQIEAYLQIMDNTSMHTELVLPGVRPFKEFKGSSAKPSVSKRCTSCGLCASQCPTKAISKDAPDITDKSLCIACMRCVTICPNQARYVPQEILDTIQKNLAPLCEGRKPNRLYLPKN